MNGCVLAVLFGLPAMQASDEILTDTVAWRQPGRCGVNALYVLLKGSVIGRRIGVPSYSSFAARVSFTEQGSSMKELQEGGNANGFDCEVVKVAPNEIWKLPLPALIHLDTLDQGGAGHFIVLFDPDTKLPNARFIDGATGQVTDADRKFLERMFTGYALLPRGYHGKVASVFTVANVLAALALLGLAVVVTGGVLGKPSTTHR